MGEVIRLSVTFASEVDELAIRFLRKPLSGADAISLDVIEATEQSLSLTLPQPLRAYYSKAGRCSKLNSAHNRIVHPAEIEIADEHLLFMHENQNVVSWGFRLAELGETDPTVWQRNNTEMAWYSEEKTLLPLFRSMFEWYEESGVWSPA